MVETTKSQPLLQVRNLTVELPSGTGRFTAVNDISFDISPGEVVALVGESGSGKTATALSILRLWQKDIGVEVFGSAIWRSDDLEVDLLDCPDHTVRKLLGSRIAIVFQNAMNALNPSLRCGDQVAEMVRHHLKLSGAALTEKTEMCFIEAGLDNPKSIVSRFPAQLSGGQQQRVLIAMALAADPCLLIADEPTTALDATSRKTILDLLKELQSKRNLAVLLISHDLDMVQEIANKVLVMYAGKLVETGNTHDVLTLPKHPYTRGLVSCRPPKSRRLYFLPTMEDFMRISADGQQSQTTKNLEDIFKGLSISDAERKRSHSKLYSQLPIMKVMSIAKSHKRNHGFAYTKQNTGAVIDVSFDLFPGETLGLVGESGSGKTTLSRCILGLDKPDAGSVGFRVSNSDEYISYHTLGEIGRVVQYVFQDSYSSLDPSMTIGQTLLEPLDRYRNDLSKQDKRNKVLELMTEIGLKPHHFNSYPQAFSGGQRQRIAIARAVLMEPKIILCDEPVSSVDASVKAQVLNLLNELKYEYNLALVFISHDMNLVRYMSDRVLVMKQGRVVEVGEADQLFAAPKSSYTADLLST